MQNTTLQFEGWGYREIAMAAELLKAYADMEYVGAKPHYMQSVDFNSNSGNVYMVDDDDDCFMMNGDKLEQWITLPHSGREEFLTDFVNLAASEFEELVGEDKDYVESLQRAYDYLIKS